MKPAKQIAISYRLHLSLCLCLTDSAPKVTTSRDRWL